MPGLRRPKRARRSLLLESLEPRTLLAVTLGTGQAVDVSRLTGNQSEESIAINPLNPNNIVTVANNNAGHGLAEAYSFDGGVTWTSKIIADGFGTMVPALRDPIATFDEFGNLFVSYLDTSKTGVVVAVSSDGGLTFKCIATVTSPAPHAAGEQVPLVDRPWVAAGGGSVWVAYQAQFKAGDPKSAKIVTAAAQVTALGAEHVGNFAFFGIVPNSDGTNFPSISISPTGAALVTFQDGVDLAGAAFIFTSLDPDGLGAAGFNNPVVAAFTNIGGVDTIPPQSNRGITATPSVAYDRSGGPHNGRVYLVYADSPTIKCGCTSVSLRYSDDNGAHWSAPVQVNDNTADSANFQPSISVDPVTGDVAVSFYSARNDPGFGPGDRDGLANDDVEMFAALSTDGGLTFSANVQVANGPSEAALAGHNSNNDFGDYTGVAVFNDVLYPVWADNSSTLKGNPDPNNFDIATARVEILFLIAQGTTLNLTTGVPFQGTVASFTDVDPNAGLRTASDYSATIGWGDGQTTSGTIVSLGGTSYTVSGSHTYARAKTYPITINIIDNVDGKTITAQSTALVKTVAPPIPFGPALLGGAVVDVNGQAGNQSEEAIAINPTNPNNIVILSNQNNKVPVQNGALPLMKSVSFDGGATWTASNITDGYGVLVPGFGDPSLAFDNFGNLFASYLDSTKKLLSVAVSTDGGSTFRALTTFEMGPHDRNVADQPTITTGPGTTSPSTVWVTFKDKDSDLKAVGAPVYGKDLIGFFGAEEDIPSTAAGNFGDISVGPDGQVLVTYQVPIADEGPSMIFTNVDPDGLGGAGFGAAIPVPPQVPPLLPYKTSTTFVGGFDPIPAQSVRTIDAEAGLAYDRTGGPYNGRVYMVYTDASALRSPNTDIYVRYSDNNGFDWSNPLKVNDDTTENSQFFPKIVVDQATGHVAISWYDARNDPGFGPGDRDGHANDDVEIFAAVSIDGGVTFSPNLKVSSGPSESAIAGHNGSNDFGDYMGLAFLNDVFYPAWADNSVGLAGNPDPNNFDIATAKVSVLFNIPVNGMPNPATITGVLNGNKVTNNNQPNFTGTAEPGATVQLFALSSGQVSPVQVGQTTADAAGTWSITSAPLADGNYNIYVKAIDLAGRVSPLVQILPGNGMGQLIIDTVGPIVTGLEFNPLQGQIKLTFQDERSGLDQASLADRANYVLVKSSRPGQVFSVTSVVVTPQISPTAPQTAVLTFNNGQRLRGVDYLIRVVSGGVKDLAGNALDGEFFGVFPSGNRQRGGDFLARLDSIHNTIFPAEPLVAPPVAGAGHFARSGHRQNHASRRPVPIGHTRVASVALHDLALAQVQVPSKQRRRGS